MSLMQRLMKGCYPEVSQSRSPFITGCKVQLNRFFVIVLVNIPSGIIWMISSECLVWAEVSHGCRLSLLHQLFSPVGILIAAWLLLPCIVHFCYGLNVYWWNWLHALFFTFMLITAFTIGRAFGCQNIVFRLNFKIRQDSYLYWQEYAYICSPFLMGSWALGRFIKWVSKPHA